VVSRVFSYRPPRRSVVTLLAAKVDLYYPPANPAKSALIRRTSY
jgi:hypothetical protein